LSHRRLPSACTSASHRTNTYYCAPLMPLVQLVVPSPLITPPPPVSLCLHFSLHLLSGWLLHHLLSHRRFCLSSHRRLSLHPSCASYPADCCSPCPSYASCPAGCGVTSRHATTSCPPAPLPLIAPLSRLLSGSLSSHLLSCQHRLQLPVPPPLIGPPPLIAPLSCLFSGSLSCHLLSRRHLLSACPPPLIAPPPLTVLLLRLLSGWLLHCLLSCCCLLSACTSASQRTAASHHAPLAIMCTMQGRRRSVAPHSHSAPNRIMWQGDSHGHIEHKPKQWQRGWPRRWPRQWLR
jgi:hypothetical protein